jgi:hypothetical protein
MNYIKNFLRNRLAEQHLNLQQCRFIYASPMQGLQPC